MPPKINRLKKKKDIERVFGGGESFKEDFLILKIIKNNLTQPRFGFVVSKEVSKRAALRNTVKRRLNEITRTKLGGLKKGIDALLIARPGLETKNFREIDETINKLFKKARFIKNDF